jgi:hypothetical protein
MYTGLQLSPFLCWELLSSHRNLGDFSYCFPEVKPSGNGKT